MKILITAGSTQMPIDKVRVLTNIFKGRTGYAIAHEAATRGIYVTLVANKNIVDLVYEDPITAIKYRTFDELESIMKEEITSGKYDAIIHSAAVSDYKVQGVYDNPHIFNSGPSPRLSSETNLSKLGKIKSGSHLYIHLTPTIKLIDQIRKPWGFNKLLVKFKLQVGITDDELIEIAQKSMKTSGADLIVANCLEWAHKRAYIIESEILGSGIHNVRRNKLHEKLLNILVEL